MTTSIRSEATRSVIEVNGVDRLAINDDGSIELLTDNLTPSGKDIVGMVNFGSSLSSSGWQKLPSGLIIQWGKATLTAGAGFTTITYPVAFPNSAFSVVASPADNAGGATIEAEEIGTVTTSNFQAAVITTGGAGSNTNLRWFAIGY